MSVFLVGWLYRLMVLWWLILLMAFYSFKKYIYIWGEIIRTYNLLMMNILYQNESLKQMERKKIIVISLFEMLLAKMGPTR